MMFLSGLPTRDISLETGIERKKVLKALLLIRTLMAQDIPEVSNGGLDVDQASLGDQWRRTVQRDEIQKGRLTRETPVFGILCRSGKVWAERVPDVGARTLLPIIDKQGMRGPIICQEPWNRYTGIAAKGYVHRIIDQDYRNHSNGSGNHDGLESFWGYLKRKLTAKGGIRKERLPLYLAEYVWRYNHRESSFRQQANQLCNLLTKKK